MRIEQLQPNEPLAVQQTAALYAQVFAEAPWLEQWTQEDALRIVQNPKLRWWIARDNKTQELAAFVAGCIASPQEIATAFGIPISLVNASAKIGYKSELGVAPGFRRLGLARRMSMYLLDWFGGEQVEQFLVRTRPGTGNHPWYEGKLERLYSYPDGRVLFGASGIPKL